MPFKPFLRALPLATAALFLAVVLASPASRAEPAADVRPVVVKIHADWCGTCKMLEGTWAALRETHGQDVRFLVYDVTDRARLAESMEAASRLGVLAKLDGHTGKTGTIVVLSSAPPEVVAAFKGEVDPARYAPAIAKAKGS